MIRHTQPGLIHRCGTEITDSVSVSCSRGMAQEQLKKGLRPCVPREQESLRHLLSCRSRIAILSPKLAYSSHRKIGNIRATRLRVKHKERVRTGPQTASSSTGVAGA
jgi:hypothetical protein